MTRPANSLDPAGLLQCWLDRQLQPEQSAWLTDQVSKVSGTDDDRALYLAISLVPRKLGKADLALSAEDLAEATGGRSGWDPRGWSVDQAARVLLLLRGGGAGEAFAKRLKSLLSTADVVESVAFLSGLPLYPEPERYVLLAREGARTSMQPVFEAVAHRNPYPVEQFDENAWNHLVLKALFIGTTLHPIQGLDSRANGELARILRDYAHERWAAGRLVTPELWRCVGRFADKEALTDLERVLTGGSQIEREGAALALAACPRVEAKEMLARHSELDAAIKAGTLSWASLAAQL